MRQTGPPAAHLLPIDTSNLDSAIIGRVAAETKADEEGSKVGRVGIGREIVDVLSVAPELFGRLVPRPGGEMVEMEDELREQRPGAVPGRKVEQRRQQSRVEDREILRRRAGRGRGVEEMEQGEPGRCLPIRLPICRSASWDVLQSRTEVHARRSQVLVSSRAAPWPPRSRPG